MKPAYFVCLYLLVAGPLLGQLNPTPFINQPLEPASVSPGGPGFLLTVNGGNFVQDSVVNWNSQPLLTTYISVTKLTATVPATDVALRSTANVTVSNPSPGGGASSAALLPIFSPVTNLSFKQSRGIAGNSPISIVVADFNGDGKADLAFVNSEAGPNNPILVSTLLGNGHGTFTPGSTISYLTGPPPFGEPVLGYQILTGDFNGDGKIDLVFSSEFDFFTYFGVALGNGDGTFQDPFYAGGGESGTQFTIGDFNRDGRLDLANFDFSSQEELTLYLGNGDGTFTQQTTFNFFCCQGTRVAGDFNADGVLDLVAGGNILLGNGDGTFSSPEPLTETNATAPTVGDFNNDGIPDLIFPGNPATVFLGNSDGTFTQKPQPTGFNSDVLVAADFNRDGKLDLASIDGFSPMVSLFLGNGNGTFQPPLNYPVTAVPSSIAFGDFNNDGLLDLALTDSNNDVSILLQRAGKAGKATAIKLLSSSNPSNFGQSLTLLAAVIPNSRGIATGTVSFWDGLTNIGISSLQGGGFAFLSISTLTSGYHGVTAAYSGDANFAPSASLVLSQIVQ